MSSNFTRMPLESSMRANSEMADFFNPVLHMLPPTSRLFDNVSTSGSDVTVISGPFSDFGNEPDVDKGRGSQDLSEQDLYTALSFSSDLKAVMDEIRSEIVEKDPFQATTESMMNESFEEIRSGAIAAMPKRKIPPATQMKIVAMLNDKAFKFGQEAEDEEEEEKTKKKSPFGWKRKKDKEKEPEEKKKWGNIKEEMLGGKKDIMKEIKKLKKREQSMALIKAEELAYETMSGYWRMLSVYEDFKIAPPGFNAYAQEQPHWLQQKPMPYHVYEDARRKCMDWLSKHFIDY